MPIYQLLVRVKDKINPNSEILSAKLMKRGDVVHVADENHVWGTKELSNPDWRILKVELTKEQAESLLAPEHPPDLLKEYKMLRKRAIRLNLDSMDVATNLLDTRDDPKSVFEKSFVESAIEVKERLAEPDVIGDEGIVIGV